MPYHLATPHQDNLSKHLNLKTGHLQLSSCKKHKLVNNREIIPAKSLVINEKISEKTTAKQGAVTVVFQDSI